MVKHAGDKQDQILEMLSGLLGRMDNLENQVTTKAKVVSAGGKPPPVVNGEDVSEEAKVLSVRSQRASQKDRRVPLVERVRSVLEEASLNNDQIAEFVGESKNPSAVADALKQLRASKVVVNVGSEDFPAWFLRPGDSADNVAWRRAIVRLLRWRSMSQAEIVRATGRTPKMVDDDMIEIRRTENVWRMGQVPRSRAALWQIMPQDMTPPPDLDGRLTRKKSSG